MTLIRRVLSVLRLVLYHVCCEVTEQHLSSKHPTVECNVTVHGDELHPAIITVSLMVDNGTRMR